jgi:nucleoside-triphosphatase THEP1
MSNKIIILTGEVQTGKTTSLQQFCAQRNNVAGILTPIIKGKRMFYDISGKISFEMEASEGEEKLIIGKYLFSAASFKKANHILLQESKRDHIGYLIIDEIGPLEIKQQKGFYNSFTAILNSLFSYTLIIVVRQALVEDVVALFNLKSYNTEIHKDHTDIHWSSL